MRQLFWLVATPILLFSATFSIEGILEDTHLVLDDDMLGFNGTSKGVEGRITSKELLQPYFKAIFCYTQGKLFHYDEPKALFSQTELEACFGYSLPINKKDIFRFNPYLGLGFYYQNLSGWNKTTLAYLPLGFLLDYNIGKYFTLGLDGAALPQIQVYEQSQEQTGFKKIPSSIGFRLEIPLSLAMDPYKYVSINFIPFYQYIPFGNPPFGSIMTNKAELQQVGLKVGFDAAF